MATLEIRDVPDGLRAILEKRAADAGQSLSKCALELLRTSTEYPTYRELNEHIRKDAPVETTTRAADLIRADRDSR
ncbi:MAG: hypothetical protein ACR2FV_05340 [Ornithinimicrobium sp.]|uniref:hypothetical protein n=1 Tax=Ornithinimicrobium sp. TaxID=1977084 RepID=UPI003D9BF674